MKTNIFSPKKTSLYSLIGFLSMLLTSCGSYQNSSYYESDGIYGTTTRAIEKTAENNPNTQYQDYFNSLQNNNQPTEIFTDVDNYGNYDNLNDSIQVTNPSYAGWGSSPENVSVSFYDNGWNNWYGSSWGWGFGFNNWYGSWGYPYYGWGYPGYGWGYPGYGWGYPNYGWGYPNYGYNNYAYNSGRRGSNYSNTNTSNRNYSSRNYSQNRNSQTDFRRNSNAISRPNYTNTRNNSFQTRNSSSAYPTRTRVNTNTNTNSRSQSYAPSRSSYSPSSSNSSSGRSSGGGGGGGRSSGGGGRGGRG